jgi:hypothetical protein
MCERNLDVIWLLRRLKALLDQLPFRLRRQVIVGAMPACVANPGRSQLKRRLRLDRTRAAEDTTRRHNLLLLVTRMSQKVS